MNTDELEATIRRLVEEEDIDALCQTFAKEATNKAQHVVLIKRIERESGMVVVYDENGQMRRYREGFEGEEARS